MKSRFFIAALIFIALTGTKLFFPERAADIRARIVPAVTRQADLQEDLVQLGRAIAGSGDRLQVWRRLTAPPEEKAAAPVPAAVEAPPATLLTEDFILRDMVRSNLAGLAPLFSVPFAEAIESTEKEDEPVVLLSEFFAPETLPLEFPPSTAELMQEKVNRFLEAQAVFADQTQPANVSYEVLIPSFEYSAPCDMPITSNFGYRDHPLEGKVKFHYGTDLGAYEGCELYAFADATVLSVSELEGYGLTVLLDHGEGFQSLYAHCSRLLVAQGDQVKRGDKIALAGQTGKVTGPHLHFELLYNGKYLNPEFYLS